MILRRSSRTDPRQLLGPTVLGSALAFVLPFGVELAAFAQSPATAQSPAAPMLAPQNPPPASAPPSSADALKAHDQELNAALAHQRESSQAQAALRTEIDALS